MIELSPYQVESADFLIERPRAMLLDAVGVGKTYPTVEAALEVGNSRPWMVTAPAYLLPTWRKAIYDLLGDWNEIAVVSGTPKQRLEALQTKAGFVLTSYNNWTSPQYSDIWTEDWNYIFDEAHRLRGRNSKWTKQVLRRANAKDTSRYWLLSGTPMVRDPGDLFPLLKLMDPKRFTSYWNFVGEWCELKVTPWQTEVGQLHPGREDEFWATVSEYSIRRSIQDVPELRDLSHTYNEILVDLPPSVVKMCKDAVKNYVIDHPDMDTPEAVSSGGALVQKLRQMTSVPPTKANPKLDALVDLLEDHQEPVIVWCWYRATADAVCERLSRDRTYLRFTGAESALAKQTVLDLFRTCVKDGDNPVLVATISAMKEGVNLQEARTQIFFEESYLPSDNQQCIARSKRRGQTQPVNVYHIHANDSLDVRVHDLQETRESGISRAMLEHVRKDYL